MSRGKLIRCASIVLPLILPSCLFAQTTTTYNLAQDWASTFPTSTSSYTSASFGTENNTASWSVGQLSYNWLNLPSTESTFLNFWNPGNGNLTSGGSANTAPNESVGTTGTYTVPFQFYAATPGTTNSVNVGLTLAQQQLSGNIPYEPSGQSPQAKITNPSGSTDSVSGGNGYMTYVDTAAASVLNSTAVRGFTNNAQQSTTPNDGTGTVRDLTGVWYNYSTTSVHSGSDVAAPSDLVSSAASGSIAGLVDAGSTFGPWAVAWTSPAAGTISINAILADQNSNNGQPAYAIMEYTPGQSGPPTVLIFGGAGTTTPGGGALPSMAIYNDGGSLTNYGYGATNGPYGQYYPGGTTSTYEYASSVYSNSGLAVSAGTEIFFATSGSIGQFGGGGGHPWGGASDIASFAATISLTTTPEPSSVTLLGLAAVGFGLAVWKRRRAGK